MKTAVLAVLLTIVQTPAPVPRKAPNNHSGAGRTIEQNRQSHQKPSGEVVPIPEPVKTDTGKQDAQIDSTKNTQQPIRIVELPTVSVKRDRMDNTAIGLTIGLLIVGTLGVCAAYRTLKTIEEQLKEIKAAGKQTDSLIAHAGKQAEAALRHAEGIVHAERAWIAINPMNLRPTLLWIRQSGDPAYEDGGRNQFGVSIKNVGRTPARVLQTCLDYVKIDDDLGRLPNEPVYLSVEAHSGLVLFPDGEPIGRVNTLRPEPILTRDEIVRIESKRLFLYAYGFIAYQCVFNCPDCPHETRFGYVYNLPQSGEPALKGFLPAGPEPYNRTT